MKRTVTALLCASILAATAPQNRAQIAPAVFVIGSATIAMVMILYVTKKSPSGLTNHTFVLLKSVDHANWVPVATNSIRLTLDKAWPIFEMDMQDNTAFYRLKEIPHGSRLCVSGRKERAIEQ